MKNQKGYAVAVIMICLALLVAVGYGWINNIISIIHSDFAPLTGILVARIIGVFVAPLGAVLGYF